MGFGYTFAFPFGEDVQTVDVESFVVTVTFKAPRIVQRTSVTKIGKCSLVGAPASCELSNARSDSKAVL